MMWQGQIAVPSDFPGCVATIGVFDGVHRGHQTLISAAVAEAHERGIPSVLVTFDPHPIAVFLPEKTPPQLTTVSERAEYAKTLGIDHVLVINFTNELAGLSPEVYFRSLLLDTLKAQAVFVGENFTFGQNAQGTTETLRDLGVKYGVDVKVIDLLQDCPPMDSAACVTEEADAARLCSSMIRQYLERGDVRGAQWVLGRRFSVTSKIVHGAGRGGAELGYPTANLYFPESMALPSDGVYAAWLTVVDKQPIDGDMEPGVPYMAAVSVGTNPTFGADPRSVESFVLDKHADLYGHSARVEFVDRVRDMVKFDSVEQLLENMARDVETVREILSNHPAEGSAV